MAAFSDDFLRFLYTNYPDDYRRASVKGVKDDVITAIMSRHEHHYAIWCQIPEWIKARYADKIPPEVLRGNETTQQFINAEVEKTKAEESKVGEAIDAGVTALAYGYTAATAAGLAHNAERRQDLEALIATQGLTEELLARWIGLRRQDISLITNDWQTNQPEKYLLHLAKSISRERKRAEMTGGMDADTEQRIAEMERELQRYAGQLGNREAKLNMVEYLRGQPQQAALRHLDPSVLAMFSGLMEQQGIRIEPNTEGQAYFRELLGEDSLTASLRQDFETMRQSEMVFTRADRNDRRVTNFVAHNEERKQNRAANAQRRRGHRQQQRA